MSGVMDLSQASDSISYQTLLVKWKYLALYKSYYKWVESYLTDTSQPAEIPHTTNNKLSKFQSTKTKYKTWSATGFNSWVSSCHLLCKRQSNWLTNHNLLQNKHCLYTDESNLIISEKSYEELEMHTVTEHSKIQECFIKYKLLLH